MADPADDLFATKFLQIVGGMSVHTLIGCVC
jgi:hypothetical protein